jgi:2TM domain
MVTEHEYKQAERELMLKEAKRGWQIHAAVYAIVMTGLTVLNVLLVHYTSASFYWFPFPLVGWGIGIAMHYYHGVRHADREITKRQTKIERLAGGVHPAT